MSTGTMSASGDTAKEAREKLNSKLLLKAGKAYPQSHLEIKKNPDGSYTATVTMKR